MPGLMDTAPPRVVLTSFDTNNASGAGLMGSTSGSVDLFISVFSAKGKASVSPVSLTLGASSTTDSARGRGRTSATSCTLTLMRHALPASSGNYTARHYTAGVATVYDWAPTDDRYQIPVASVSPTMAAPALTVYTANFFVTLDTDVSVLTGRGYVLVQDLEVGDTLDTTVSRPRTFTFRPRGSDTAAVTVSLSTTRVNYRVDSITAQGARSSLITNGIVTGSASLASDNALYNLTAVQRDYLGGAVNDVLESTSAPVNVPATPTGQNSLPANTTINGLPIVSYDSNSTLLFAEGAPIVVDGSGAGLLTDPGDILIHDQTTPARLPVGADGQHLVANPDVPAGLEWVTQQIERRVFHGDASPWSLGSVPANKAIKKISLRVLQAFNDANATLSLGSIGSPEMLVAAADSYPQQVGTYEVDLSLDFNVATELFLFINAGASNTGEVQLTIDLQS